MPIRPVRQSDAARLAAIYAPYVTDSAFTFETEAPSAEEFEERIGEIIPKFPWLVYQDKGEVIGYAYASPHRSRCAYEWSVESTVYVSHEHHGKEVGTELYRELFRLLQEQGVVNVLAGITNPNEKSTRLHESFGFEQIGLFKDIGFKQGRWWDVSWWQLQLQRPDPPRSLTPPKL